MSLRLNAHRLLHGTFCKATWYARTVSAGGFGTARTLLSRWAVANNGVPATIRRTEDGFSEAVVEYVKSLGHIVKSTTENDAFGLDFAIEHPSNGLFAIGIECDAPRHPLLERARAREVWRPSVLRRAVPIIHRVSSQGWYQDGEQERSRLREALDKVFREHGFDATTLRMIGERAGLGASSIYRHIRSKEELLVEELAEIQERAWKHFRAAERRDRPARERLRRFLDVEHRLLAQDRDFTVIMLRATTHPKARVAKRVLALQDRAIGLVAEILQSARARKELKRDANVLAAARTILYATNGARIAWANGQLDAEECREAIATAVDLLFEGIAAHP